MSMLVTLLVLSAGTSLCIQFDGNSQIIPRDQDRPPARDRNGDGVSLTGPGAPWEPMSRPLKSIVTTYPRTSEIDLDLPPRERWKTCMITYRSEIIPYWEELKTMLDNHIEIYQPPWIEALSKNYPKEYLEEMHGIIETINHPAVSWEAMLLFHSIYELGDPILSSNLLMAAPDGTVLHGRNLDYKLIGPVIETTFVRNGKPVYASPMYMGTVGIHTGVKLGHWTFGHGTRINEDDTPTNTLKRAKMGANSVTMMARTLMDSDVEYDHVVAQLREKLLIRASFFIVSGAGPYQGTSITRSWDPGFRYAEELNTLGQWHIFQTDDNAYGPPSDDRRDTGLQTLSKMHQSMVNIDTMVGMMHNPPIYKAESNVVFFVMSAKSGKSCSILGGLVMNDDISNDCQFEMADWDKPMPVDSFEWNGLGMY